MAAVLGKGTLVIAAVLLLCAVSSSAYHPTGGISGTHIHTKEGAQMLRGVLSCYSKWGRWVRNPRPRKLPWIRESYGWETECDRQRAAQGEGLQGDEADRAAASQAGDWDVREELKYEWQVDRCPWRGFTYHEFCKVMWSHYGSNASILIVGDELAWGFERRLFYNMLAGASRNYHPVNLFPNGCEWGKVDKSHCSGYRYCHDVLDGESVAVRFVRNDDVSLTRAIVDGKNLPWMTAISIWKARVLLLSHTAPNTPEEEFRTNVAEAAKWVSKFYPTTLLIYRNTPSPTAYCKGDSREASAFVPDTEEVYARQNEIAKEVVKEAGGLYMDVNASVAGWPEKLSGQSGACLKYCQPGRVDAWVALFLNTLVEALPKVDAKAMAAKNGAQEMPLEERRRKTKCTVPRYAGSRLDEGPPPALGRPIPGSRAQSASEVQAVRQTLRCFSLEGSWRYNPSARPLPWLRKPWGVPSISACDERHLAAGGLAGPAADEVAARGGAWNVREDLKWEWRTGGACPLEGFSRERFCRIVGSGRSIMFVGDSMTGSFERQLFFNMLMGSDLEKYPPVDLHPEGLRQYDVGSRTLTCRGYAFCHDLLAAPITTHFCFNRVLSLTRVPLDGEAPWVTTLELWKPSVLVLNRGAHFCEDGAFKEGVRDALRYVRRKYPEMLLLWRNTPVGHWNCSEYKGGPVKTPIEQTAAPPAYHWVDLGKQNEIAKPLVEEVGGVFFDVESMTSLRPDGHPGLHKGLVDCLHYCQPGVQDTWVMLLQNYLAQLL